MGDEHRLSLAVRHVSGQVSRWAPDELAAENVPGGLSFSTALPGGFKQLSLALTRRIDEEYEDLNPLDEIELLGPGGEIAWEGLQAELPREHGDDARVSIDAVGWASTLQYDPFFRAVYVDRDMASWVEPTLNRRLSVAVAGHGSQTRIGASAEQQAIVFSGSRGSVEDNERAELMYLMPAGLAASVFQYRCQQAGTHTNFEAETLFSSAADNISSAAANVLTADDTLRSATIAAPVRYLMLRLLATATHSPAAAPSFTYKQVAVYGAHGLALHDIEDQPDGVLASDVIAHIVATAAPSLRVSADSIEPTGFVIPHLAFRDPVTPEDAILATNAYELRDWGVYDERTFFYRDAASYRERWATRIDEGAQLDAAGPQSEELVNGVIVFFTDHSGTARTAGPPGSGADYEDASLEDASTENPVNAQGLGRKWGRLEVGPVTTSGGAIRLGSRWLAAREPDPSRGSVDCPPLVRDSSGIYRPSWQVRAGDSLRIEDGDNREKRIVETSYTHATHRTSASLDAQPYRLDAIIERLGVVLTGVAD